MIQSEIEDFLSVYKTIHPQRKFVYISTPITTGPRFIEWYKKIGKDYTDKSMYAHQHKICVIKLNEVDAKTRAEDLFIRLNELIINPAEFKPNFTQVQFIEFWKRFIQDYVSTIIFSDGWSFSRGCLNELLAAFDNDIKCMDYKLQSFNQDYAIKEIEKACSELHSLGLDYGIQRQVLEVLKDEK